MAVVGTAAAVGTAFSIYNGVQQGKAAKAAQNQQQQDLANNQAIAAQVQTQENTLGYDPLKKQEQQDQAMGLTPQGQMASDRFKADMQQSNQQIQAAEPTAGAGVSGSRALTNQFRQAQGLASIQMGDTAQKQSNLRQDIGIGVQNPGWAGIATGANQQQANFQGGLASQANQNQQSAYGAAAQGLMGMASMYGSMDPGDGSSPVSGVNVDSGALGSNVTQPQQVDPGSLLPQQMPATPAPGYQPTYDYQTEEMDQFMPPPTPSGYGINWQPGY